MASITDFERKKVIDVRNVSGTPSKSKAQPVYVTDGSESTTGTGDIAIPFTNIASKSDLAFFDENGGSVPYQWIGFNSSGFGVAWVYRTYTRDGSSQLQLAYNNTSNSDNNENATGTWNNSSQNCTFAAPLSGQFNDFGPNNTSFPRTDNNFNPASIFDNGNGVVQAYDSTEGDFATAQASNATDDPEQLSLVTWFNLNRTPDSGAGNIDWISHFNNNRGEESGGFDLCAFSNSDQLGWQISDGSTFTQIRSDLPDSEYEGVWNLMAATHDDSDDFAKLFKNSNLESSNTLGARASPSNDLGIGGNPGTNTSQLAGGKIHMMRIYSKIIDSTFLQFEVDATAKGGKTFFSQQAAQKAGVRLEGQVTLDGSPVQGAVVYAFDNTDKAFVGNATTDSNGNYNITPSKQVSGNEVLIGVDHDTGSERFGEEKSTVV